MHFMIGIFPGVILCVFLLLWNTFFGICLVFYAVPVVVFSGNSYWNVQNTVKARLQTAA